jgi:hypothetical protein
MEKKPTIYKTLHRKLRSSNMNPTKTTCVPRFSGLVSQAPLVASVLFFPFFSHCFHLVTVLPVPRFTAFNVLFGIFNPFLYAINNFGKKPLVASVLLLQLQTGIKQWMEERNEKKPEDWATRTTQKSVGHLWYIYAKKHYIFTNKTEIVLTLQQLINQSIYFLVFLNGYCDVVSCCFGKAMIFFTISTKTFITFRAPDCCIVRNMKTYAAENAYLHATKIAKI